MSIETIQRQHWRIAILRLLSDQAGGGINESMINDALPACGVTPTRDQVRSELAWLKEQGLVGLIPGRGADLVMILTRGSEVAAGRISHPGIKIPSAEAIMQAAAATAKSLLDG